MADTTKRKRAKEVLRQSEEHLRLIIDTIPTMAWTLRPDGTVDFVNQRSLDYMGLSFEEEIEAKSLVARSLELDTVRRDPGEVLEVFHARWRELHHWVSDARITDGKTIIGIRWLEDFLAAR